MSLHQHVSEGFEQRLTAEISENGTVWNRWTLIGPAGAVTFTLRTGGKRGWEALPFGIDGHHKTAPEHADCCAHTEHCDYLDGPCWSDGTSLGASELWDRLQAADYSERDDLLWTTLREYYDAWFPTEGTA